MRIVATGLVLVSGLQESLRLLSILRQTDLYLCETHIESA